MKIAVLSLTRDRFHFTEHCFKILHQQDIGFDHYVLDQGSRDGTAQWLAGKARFNLTLCPDNIGISAAMNRLLDQAGPDYDVYVKFDNDCELTRFDTLRMACQIASHPNAFIASPKIEGLKSPPAIERNGEVFRMSFDDSAYGHRVGYVGQIGGIFMAIPGWVFNRDGFRYDENNPKWGMDDVRSSQWFRNKGGELVYMMDHRANHYLTTVGQEQDQPAYFQRKYGEMGIA